MKADGLKRQTGGPMYHQVRQDLLARIRRGEFSPGSQLPSENQLCREYGVSVTTARRAFLELVNEGIVVRRAGVGTMVASRVRKARLAFVSIDYIGDAWRNISSIMGEIIAGVGECTWNNDATLNMVGVEEHEAASYLRNLAEDRLSDGVLVRVANDIQEEHLDILERAGLPYVVIKRHIPGRRMNCVISDDVAGARMATSHLLDLGYERIGFACAKPGVMIGKERLAGYRAALGDRGIEFDETLVRQEPYFTSEMGYRATKSLLEMPVPPQAIFVASDTMALGAYRAAQELGLRIPGDLAVVGYDDIAPAAVMQPPLTTVRTSFYDFGAMATELLLDLIDGREVAPKSKTIEPTLIVRSSTGSTVKEPASTSASASAAVSVVKPRLDETSQMTTAGRLSGKEVVCSIFDKSDELRIARACEAGGATVELAGDFRRAVISDDPDAEILTDSTGRADVLVYGFAADGAGELPRALSYGRAVAEQMSGHGGGCILYAASRPTGRGSRGGAENAASEAAIRQATRVLSDEISDYGVRVNTVLYPSPTRGGEAGFPTGTATFLISDEAYPLSGETLDLDDPTGGGG